MVQGPPIALTGPLVSKIVEEKTEQGPSLVIELTAEGRTALADASPSDQTAAGLALVVEGLVEGVTTRATLSGKQMIMTLASGSDLEAAGIIAAIRGPTLPSELERLN
jgi:hypothetical protein